jgi:hypothetical protein
VIHPLPYYFIMQPCGLWCKCPPSRRHLSFWPTVSLRKTYLCRASKSLSCVLFRAYGKRYLHRAYSNKAHGKKKRRAKKIFVVHLKKTHGASPKNTHQRGARARNDMRGTTVNDLSREPHVPRPLPCVPRRRTTKFQKNCDYLPSFYLSTATTLPFTLYFNSVLISIILLFLTNFFR